jgi:GGDEF domain-containing protein
MEPTERTALVALASRRFRSFAEAAETTLGALVDALPGTLVLGQFDAQGEACRVTDLVGDPISGLERGATLRVAATAEEWLDCDLLRSAGIESSFTEPLEMGDGKIVGLLCALATPPNAFGPGHLTLLAVGARILSHAWEDVRMRVEVRQLRGRLRDSGTTDADTGLANRVGFSDALEREWRLAKRNSVESTLVACRILVPGARNGQGSPIAKLALKDAADVLAGSARGTDHVARVGPATLAAILVGCDGPAGAEAFIARYTRAVERATESRPFAVEVSYAYRDLAQADSAPDALAEAQSAAATVGDVSPQASVEQEAGG